MTTHRGSTRRTRPASLLALLLLLLTLAACASDEGASSSGGSSAGEEDQATTSNVPGDRNQSQGAPRVAPIPRAVISTGSVELRSDDVEGDRARVLRLVAGYGGTVADEQSTGDDRGSLRSSSLTLRVPSERFDDAMTELAELGTVLDQSRAAEDVTTQVIDNDARVRAQERSVRRVEALLSEAEELGDVIAIEADLARRQADLDSLTSQQAYLSDQTSLSTITVGLDKTPRAGPEEDADGFLAGLRSGWTALSASSVVLLTSLGAVLPFAVATGVVGVPLWLVARRRRRTPLLAPTTEAT